MSPPLMVTSIPTLYGYPSLVRATFTNHRVHQGRDVCYSSGRNKSDSAEDDFKMNEADEQECKYKFKRTTESEKTH